MGKKAKLGKRKTVKDLRQTEIVVVLDRSGSMSTISRETVNGFNSFLREQQESKGESFITLVQFDDQYEVNYKSIPVKHAAPLTLGENYMPRGGTSLLDAIGQTIQELETDRDVVFVIITDGEENSSKEYKREAIFKMISTLTEENQWKFLFLGANQDAIQAGGSLGVAASNSITYAANSVGATRVFATMSSNIADYMDTKAVMYASCADPVNMNSEILAQAESSLFFTDEQKDEQTKLGAK